MPEYLVTGATGFVGNNVVRALLAAGSSVRACVRKSSDERPLTGLDVERVTADVCDRESIERAVQGVNCVIHAAADLHIGWKHWDRCRAINVEGTRHVVGAASKHGASLIHVSSVDTLSAGSIGEPVSEETPIRAKLACTYVVTKQESEAIVESQVPDGFASHDRESWIHVGALGLEAVVWTHVVVGSKVRPLCASRRNEHL